MDKRNIVLAIATAALALCAVAIAAMQPPAAETAETTVPVHTPAITQDPDGPTASDLWSNDSSLRRIKPLDIPLEAETQWAIYKACEYDTGLFCLVMAIAEHESEFQPDLTGDNGQSLGMMQINTKWHTGRMEALGVTDLTDPVQCAAVAIDYLQELEDRYGFEPESEALLMAYNMGPSGARRAINEGRTSTDYSREIMTVYQGYLAELEGVQ